MSFTEGYNPTDHEDGNANIIYQNRNNNSSENLYSSASSNVSQHVNSIPLITIDSDDKEDEINWTKLPSLAVENVYAFLSRTDQSRMSQVCSRWAKDFNSPTLWKTMKFYLPEHDYFSDIYPEVRFARKYASMFQNVEIICKTVKIRLISVVCRQLKLFLQAMASSSQLVSIKFINMGNYLHNLDDTLHQALLQAIISFLNTQENLKTVAFQDSRFTKEESMELLKAILHNNSPIRNLSLRGFVNDDPLVILSQQYTSNLSEVCVRISNVISLEVDYTQTFEDVINCLHAKISSGDFQLDRKKCRMSTLNIYCDGTGHLGFRGILPGAWKSLRNVFPELKVKLDVKIRRNLNVEMEKFLMKEIPLESLYFRYEKFSSPSRIDISSVITHLRICKYNDHLESLNILWIPSKADFIGSIVPFVQSCKKLQNIHIHVTYTPPGIPNIIMALLENHPTSLKTITLWFSYLNEGYTEDSLREISEEYYPLFKAQGIDCFLFVDPVRNLRNRELYEIAN